MSNVDNVFISTSELEHFHSFIVNKDFENLFQIKASPSVNDNCSKQHVQENVFNPEILANNNAQKQRKWGNKVCSIGGIRKQFENEQAEKLQKRLAEIEKCINSYRASNKRDSVLKSKIETYLSECAPLNRASFKGLSNINLDEFLYKQQFIEVDGKKILLAGSVGGNVDCIKAGDLIFSKKNLIDKPILTTPICGATKRKSSLLSYGSTKFKPGPLSKKPRLNCSDIRTKIELMEAPAICLEVYPKIGAKLDPTACFYLGNILKSDSLINADWAKFASSLVTEAKSPESCPPSTHRFILPYTNNQNRILMQKDLDWIEQYHVDKDIEGDNTPIDSSELDTELENLSDFNPLNDIESSVKSVIADLVHTVCVRQYQDRVWKYDTDYVPIERAPSETAKKEKMPIKRRHNNELKRLDVTIIDYNDATDVSEQCSNEYCKLGCVCSSLRASHSLNNHCGQPECMLRCVCSFDRDFSNKSRMIERDSKISNFTVANLQNHMNRFLSKEEKKFRRTVIRSNNQTVAIGACRRGSRVPKKYEDFILPEIDANRESMNRKHVKVSLMRLPASLKLHPFCMVHKLYRCFCKNVFTAGFSFAYTSNRIERINLCLPVGKHPVTGPGQIKFVLLPEPKKVVANNISETDTDVLSELSENVPNKVCDVEVIANSTSKSDLKQSPSPSNSDNKKSCTDVTCSRTSYNERYIRRSKKKTLKLREINSRRKREEESNPSLNKRLHELSDQAFKATVISGVDPDPLDLWKSPSTDDTNPNQSPSLNIVECPKTSDNEGAMLTNHPNLFVSASIDKKYLNFMLRNACLLNPLNANKFLPPYKAGNVTTLLWETLLSQFLNGDIHIWASASKPYKIFITDTEYSGPIRCINVFNNRTDKRLFEDYPSILKDILTLDGSKNSLIVLVGVPHAWEAVAVVSKIPKLNMDKVGTEKKMSLLKSDLFLSATTACSSQPQSSCDPDVIINLPEISSIRGNYNVNNKNNTIGFYKFKWFCLSYTNSFEILSVRSKKIFINRKKIEKAIALSHSTKKIVAILAYIQLQKHYTLPHFGIYIVPKNKSDPSKGPCKIEILLGPYKIEENSGIQTLKENNPVPIGLQGCWLEDAVTYSNNTMATDRVNVENIHRTIGVINTWHVTGHIIYLSLTKINETPTQIKVINPSLTKTRVANSEHKQIRFRIVKCLQNGAKKSVNAQKSLLKPLEKRENISPKTTIESKQPGESNKNESVDENDNAEISVIENTETNEKKKSFESENTTKTEYGQVEMLDEESNGEEKNKIIDDNEESDVDDVIFMPAVNEVVEISDSEEDEDEKLPIKSVWFICNNIPELGYIQGKLQSNCSVSIIFETIGCIPCSSPMAATIKIDDILKKFVGFSQLNMNSSWQMVTRSKDISHLQPFDERKFNKRYIITKDGFAKKRKTVQPSY